MQEDMHFWGTYVVTRAAGFPMKDAHTIAYAAQYVDDSNKQDSTQHEDGGLLYGIATAHHPKQSALNSVIDREEQRRVWVPFHFIPGGEGKTFQEKLLCVKDSNIAQEMINYHIAAAKEKAFGLELTGIAAHVYMDTFSHYGFSGISSEYNEVDGDSFKFVNINQESSIGAYISNKREEFIAKYLGSLAEAGSSALGHAGVATYPDRPFLHWEVDFEHPRSNGAEKSDRNNPETYLEGCKKLHSLLSAFAETHYEQPAIRSFEDIKDSISSIIRYEGDKGERIDQWKKAIKQGAIYKPEESESEKISYDWEEWEDEKKEFHEKDSSSVGIDTHAYRFHQAAAFHRYYVLKDLLPKHGIAVY